ncbi:unnamed protein product [Sphagnum troendelagicum]|jgi:hypothetical protein
MLRSNADFWLVRGRYILDIEIAIALVFYLKSLQGRYEVGNDDLMSVPGSDFWYEVGNDDLMSVPGSDFWYEVGIPLAHTMMVGI